mgnify:CR=1 FL=1
MGIRLIKIKKYNNPKLGDLVYVLEGNKYEIGIVVAIDGSLWHKHIQDWSYYILVPSGKIKKIKGSRVEKIRFSKD